MPLASNRVAGTATDRLHFLRWDGRRGGRCPVAHQLGTNGAVGAGASSHLSLESERFSRPIRESARRDELPAAGTPRASLAVGPAPIMTMYATSTTSSQDRYKPCILLAEDDDAFRSLLAAQLRADGYRVIDVRDGTEALEYLMRFQHAPQGRWFLDLVVTDIHMPGLTGLDLASVVRHDGMPARIVCITAFADAETRERARLLGADALFDKPFDLSSFRRRIATLLDRS